ncbi:MFS transporter [Leucobacter sp. NPDC077196]|uniref:MFS transporter n=1 Tax=Leucobacter sp. NPDC077196 TaxID=3154959 RepID=UPI00341FFAEB
MTPPDAASPRGSRAFAGALALAGLLLVAGNLRASLTSVGPILDRLQSELGLSSLAASMLISLPLLAFAGVSPLVPGIALRFGLERLLGASLVLLAAGIVLRSVGGAWLWVGTIVLGIAIAALNVSLPSLVKRDYPNRIGQVTGAYSVVQSVFAAIAAGVSVPLADASALGWRASLGLWAGFALLALAALIPRILRAGSPRDNAPSEVIALPGGGTSRDRFSPWKSALAWQLTAFMGVQSVAYYILILWLPSIEIASGISPAAAGFHLLIMNAVAIVGSTACSALIPRFRDQRGLGAVSGLFFLIAAVGLAFAPEWGALWAGCGGLSGGISIVLALSFFGLRTHHHRHAAAVSGMAQAVGYLCAAAGPPAIGLLHDATGSWAPALWTLGGIGVLLMGLGVLAGRDRYVQ